MRELRGIVEPLPGYPAGVGTLLWAMAECRRRTLRDLEGVTDAEVDVVPPGFDNSIGALLYHLAIIEADWVYIDILDAGYPDWMSALFPAGARQGGNLAAATGFGIADHLARLEEVRSRAFDDLKALSAERLRTPRRVESGIAAPDWVLNHLMQHEAEHRGQIQSLRKALQAQPSS